MFEEWSAQAWPRQRRLTAASLALHGLLLGWLLHTPRSTDAHPEAGGFEERAPAS